MNNMIGWCELKHNCIALRIPVSYGIAAAINNSTLVGKELNMLEFEI